MFELKKVVSTLLMPLPLLLIIGFIGLGLIMFTTRQKSGCLIILFALVGIFLASFQPVSSRLLMPLERQYKAFLPVEGSIDYVMVLGHSHIIDDQLPPTSELSRTALMRLVEGIRILRMYPGAKLILSGYAGGTQISHARMMASVALSLGVSKSDIILLEDAKDTWEEARQAAAFVRDRKLVLVTSASHMQRSMYEFHHAGLSPIPAPTNFLATMKIQQPWNKYTPKPVYMEQTDVYWHELLGTLWQKLRDSIISDDALAATDSEAANTTESTNTANAPATH